MHRARSILVFLPALGTALTLAASAHATPVVAHAADANPFGCRASGLRVDGGGSAIAEPIVANTQTYPCYDQSQGVATLSVPNGSTGALLGGPVGAFTYEAGSSGGETAPGVAAVASVQGLTIPTANGLVSIVGPAQADVAYECVNDKVTSYGQSTLDVVYVNGQKTFMPAPGAPDTIQLGGGAYMSVNERIQTATSLIERVLDIHLADGTDIVAGEAEVTQVGSNSCAGTTGSPPVLEICPPGSTLDVPAQECVIILNGGQTIINVSRPFKGPSGGTVMALSVASKRYKSPCLSGAGPKYALIATKRGGRVLGTEYSDRILARGAYERVSGLGGADCIDGSGGHQKLYDGNGKDRVYAGPGFNRVAVGNGNDYVNGRTGSDWITAGNGNDTVYGGRGSTRIDIGIGRDQLYGGPSKNRFWAAGDAARVSCGTGKHNTAFVRARAKKFAKAHGCDSVHVLS
jgi:Ca2+-binding RTX toxin-like protein